MIRKPVKMFLCSTAYEHELGRDADGTTLYPSVKALRQKCGCIAANIPEERYPCGVVEVLVTYTRSATNTKKIHDLALVKTEPPKSA